MYDYHNETTTNLLKTLQQNGSLDEYTLMGDDGDGGLSISGLKKGCFVKLTIYRCYVKNAMTKKQKQINMKRTIIKLHEKKYADLLDERVKECIQKNENYEVE